MTFGHLDVVAKAAALVDVLYVLIAANPRKTTWFSIEERQALLKSVCPSVVLVDSTQGMVVDFAKSVGATWLIRGVRTTTDATAELERAALNAQPPPPVGARGRSPQPLRSPLLESQHPASRTRSSATQSTCLQKG